MPLIEATNQLMGRLRHLLDHQKRFVRDTSHQLRTPLAVLKVQVQSAQRGDTPPDLALTEIADTVDRATTLANQMLALAKVEQLRQQDGETGVQDLADIARGVAVDLSPLLAGKDIDFEFVAMPAPVHAHEWMLRELIRNLLHNAIKASPTKAHLALKVYTDAHHAALEISDQGPGIDPGLRQRLFQPFSAGDVRSGSGLGLAICQEIVQALDGELSLDNRVSHSRVLGLDAIVRLPLATGV